MAEETPPSFFLRNEFFIRRLHSLTGIVPLGVYMIVHLGANASLMNSPGTFQRVVYQIHSLGMFLPLVEWGLILLPLFFHAGLGIWIARTGQINTDRYRITGNRRYAWQRWSGFIVLIFLLVHVTHLHGWFHFEAWLRYVADPLGMAQFRAFNAASTLAIAMDGWLWPSFYLIGILASVYHFANGLWTAGITWGLWVSAAAQQRATKLCATIGVALALLGTAAWWAAITTDAEEALIIENRMYRVAREAEAVPLAPKKRTQPDALLEVGAEAGELPEPGDRSGRE